MAWTEPDRFNGFGSSALIGSLPVSRNGLTIGGELEVSRKRVRELCPAAPGVYGMVDTHDRLIYVGKSKTLRQRLLSYFSADAQSKGRQILKRTSRLVWETAPHEFTALVRELELIRRWRPQFNVRGQPGRFRSGYLCLGRPPAPYLFVTPRLSGRSLAVFGPITMGRRLRETVRRLNHHYGLRDCPERVPLAFADQRELFSSERAAACLRYELGTCLGPCVAACTADVYARQVRALRAFLAGRASGPLERLEAQMATAVRERAFERAAVLRDAVADLEWLQLQLLRLGEARREYSFVYRVGVAADETWHWIVGGQIVLITPGPLDSSAAAECRQQAARLYARPAARALDNPEDAELLLLVERWFRHHPAELELTLARESILDACQRARRP